MDDVSRTLEEYESDADAYVRKYRSGSIAARYGRPFFEALTGSRLLDVGCGPGADISTFESAGYDVVGLDLTPSFLRAARDSDSTASLVRGDMRRLPFGDGSVDGIWSSASFLHVPRSDAAPTLREFRRVLRPAGVVFLSVKRAPTTPGESNERHFEYYGPEAIGSIVRDAGFEPVVVETEENWVSMVASAETDDAGATAGSSSR
ncbi:class I SAM-dependent methyltransferase [Natrinema salaciae]|uniref:Methyltransferase domain-containing protein n=1 Tax=Natrinema salaciae TaxID=1186196 RepID=A0A1H9JGZ1_9EURY|nr:class I SAM-dependent methyltransferase [Natrinema salaciae]SEQ86063.1 Methyltransferase domain-containing protein [Natrinema salaciae]